MKHYILILMMALTFTSCGEDFLDQSPSDQITTDEAITEVNDVKTAVNGLYALMASTYYYNASMFLYGDVKGDHMQPTYWSSGRSAYKYYTYEHSAAVTNDGGLWGRPYYIVRNAYNIIDAINSGNVKGDKATLDAYKGEALACLALAYFDLTRVYGYPYAKNNGASPGVPILEHAINYGTVVSRNTVAECYEFIIKTLKEAISLLPATKQDGHFNSYAARALLARTYLYCEKNQEAFDTASALIEEAKANQMYYLVNNANYVAMFNQNSKFGPEALFQISNTTSNNPGRDGLSYLMHWWGYAAVVITDEFGKIMTADANDVRSKLVASYYNSGSDEYYYCLLKYPGDENYWTPSNENNYTVLRLSEVYLIAAEAALKSGQNKAKGLEYLNAIVSRANPRLSVADTGYTLGRVLLERAKELVGEGHRYFDMLRNGQTMVRRGGKHIGGAPEEINWNYNKCVLPISRDEFTFNPDMEQNEGYLKN